MKTHNAILAIAIAAALAFALVYGQRIGFGAGAAQLSTHKPDVDHEETKPKTALGKQEAVKVVAPKSPEEQFKADFRTPISFYGKVIDQFGQPVSDATVSANANDNPGGQKTKRVLQTDAAGLFAIEGMRGFSLGIEVSKQGYYRVKPSAGKPGSYGGGRYVSVGGEAIYHPDKNQPVIFTLHKQGVIEPLEKIESPFVQLPSNGGPVKLGGSRQFVIRAWNKDEKQNGIYDWRCEIESVDGTIKTREGYFDFTAPETGYQQTAVIEMPSTLGRSKWHDVVHRSFFVSFNDGVFGRIEVDIAAPPHGSVQVVGLINPKVGSRNLEADPRER